MPHGIVNNNVGRIVSKVFSLFVRLLLLYSSVILSYSVTSITYIYFNKNQVGTYGKNPEIKDGYAVPNQRTHNLRNFTRHRK